MKKYYISAIIAFLLGITIFSVYQYAASLNERIELRTALEQSKEEAQVLENQNQTLRNELDSDRQEKQGLLKENAGLKDTLKNDGEEIIRLSSDLKKTVNEAQALKNQVVQFQAEKDGLNLRLSELTLENEKLQATLNSAPDLKERIRELKRLSRQASRVIALRSLDAGIEELIGNQGYLLKDGKTTWAPRIRIKVEPAILTR